MTIQGIAGLGQGPAGASIGQSGKSGSEKFADALFAARSAADAKVRVVEVGLAQYAREQHELKKLMRVLNAVRADSPEDIRQQLDRSMEGFKQNPPKTVDEALRRIETFVEAIPLDAPDHLKERMQVVFRKIKDLMAQANAEEEEQLEKLRRSGYLVVRTIG
ncbi:MAG TPA: hypothetical protein VHM01_11835 [Alphaproteobacteria bacterium]|nr:hypothetical protein [Alphaproteobacteria bacterium]